jgi:hypothetical protein
MLRPAMRNGILSNFRYRPTSLSLRSYPGSNSVAPVWMNRRWIIGSLAPNQLNPDPIDGAAPDPSSSRDGKSKWKGTAFKMFESAMTTLASISVLG